MDPPHRWGPAGDRFAPNCISGGSRSGRSAGFRDATENQASDLECDNFRWKKKTNPVCLETCFCMCIYRFVPIPTPVHFST